MHKNMNKIFIIGLPRTGTTSISVVLLNHGFKVAHTAYTKRAFELADVISDAPCFCDYQQLDKLFPDSTFIYVDRALEHWVPSMQMLLHKMLPQLDKKTGYLNPVLKRCFNTTFLLSETIDPLNGEHLKKCYLTHQQAIFNYFSMRNDFLNIDIGQKESVKKLLTFLSIEGDAAELFPRLNVGKQVDYWKALKHPNKINSLSAGREHRKFFDYV
jgi:hypothetical protein